MCTEFVVPPQENSRINVPLDAASFNRSLEKLSLISLSFCRRDDHLLDFSRLFHRHLSLLLLLVFDLLYSTNKKIVYLILESSKMTRYVKKIHWENEERKE